jgi:hypothetical protein
MFAGLRLDIHGTVGAANSARGGFSRDCVQEATERIREAIEEEQRAADAPHGGFEFGLAGGAHGGDILFHEVCHDLNIPTRLCLALPRAEYVGNYVTPAGAEWVGRFSKLYRRVDEEARKAKDTPKRTWAISCFADSLVLPRWLQGREHYNVGRRNNLWMLQHAIVAANQLGENTEITLIALYDDKSDLGIGGIGHLVKQAEKAGIKVRKIRLKGWDRSMNAEAANDAPENPAVAA